ncbi:hypothetical protein BpHYR1_032597 [Brachionus plicatilis]|uniref:Uncharacterized protein n=1 Tax=Brachionus plicatilis TaxID=10195 RepID=A0A3M7QYU9_BRAPC|nr:hypothetical protein BpHYR1_032597 [Brachionus plicatilis]
MENRVMLQLNCFSNYGAIIFFHIYILFFSAFYSTVSLGHLTLLFPNERSSDHCAAVNGNGVGKCCEGEISIDDVFAMKNEINKNLLKKRQINMAKNSSLKNAFMIIKNKKNKESLGLGVHFI